MTVFEMVEDAEKEGITWMILMLMTSHPHLSWVQAYKKIKDGE